MRLELLAHRRRGADRRLVEVGHVRRRLGRRRVEQVVENPLAAQHRRGARRVRRHRQHAALREHARRAACRVRSTRRNSGPLTSGDAVMPRQPLVEIRVLAVDEVEDAAIVADRRARRRAPSRGASRAAGSPRSRETRSRSRVSDSSARNCSHWPPKFSASALDLRVAQHAPHLRGEDRRIAQRAGIGGAPQRGVRHARPQEVGQPRRQFVLGDRVRSSSTRGGGTVAFDAEQEIGRDQQRLDADRQPSVERVLLAPARPVHERNVASRSRARVTGRRNARRARSVMMRDAHHRLMLAVRRARTCRSVWRLARDGPVGLGVRAADVDRADAHAVQRNLLQLRLGLVERFSQLSDPLGRRAWPAA